MGSESVASKDSVTSAGVAIKLFITFTAASLKPKINYVTIVKPGFAACFSMWGKILSENVVDVYPY
jgi:hypothetical protein